MLAHFTKSRAEAMASPKMSSPTALAPRWAKAIVAPRVTLQVVDLAAFQVSQVFPFDRSEPAGWGGGFVAQEAVVPAGDGDRCARVPVELVGAHHAPVLDVEFT